MPHFIDEEVRFTLKIISSRTIRLIKGRVSVHQVSLGPTYMFIN